MLGIVSFGVAWSVKCIIGLQSNQGSIDEKVIAAILLKSILAFSVRAFARDPNGSEGLICFDMILYAFLASIVFGLFGFAAILQ